MPLATDKETDRASSPPPAPAPAAPSASVSVFTPSFSDHDGRAEQSGEVGDLLSMKSVRVTGDNPVCHVQIVHNYHHHHTYYTTQ